MGFSRLDASSWTMIMTDTRHDPQRALRRRLEKTMTQT